MGIDVFGAVTQRVAAMEGQGDKRQRIVMSGLPVDPARYECLEPTRPSHPPHSTVAGSGWNPDKAVNVFLF